MATWSPIDPQDIVELCFDLSASADGKSFIPAGVTITTATVTPPVTPAGLVIVGSPTVSGKFVFFRTGYNPAGQYKINCHANLSNGEERDLDGWLTVKPREVKW